MEQHKSLQKSFNEKRAKTEKDSKIIQVLQKDLKLSKTARTAVENSTFLHSYRLEINIYKSEVNESVLVPQLI